METILFTLGDIPVTYAMAGLIGAAVVVLILLALLINGQRARALRDQALAQQAADQLKQSFLAQLADRDHRIQDLDQEVRHERERLADLLDAERDKSAELMAQVSALRARDRKSTRLNSSHCGTSRMPSSA